MVVRNSNEVVVFNTPTNNKSSDDLINFIEEKLHCKINAIVPTHFHDDCIGGLASFHKLKIPSCIISIVVNSNNIKAMEYDQKLGFKEAVRFAGMHEDGGDLVVFEMNKSDCRWIRERNK